MHPGTNYRCFPVPPAHRGCSKRLTEFVHNVKRMQSFSYFKDPTVSLKNLFLDYKITSYPASNAFEIRKFFLENQEIFPEIFENFLRIKKNKKS